MINRRNFIKSSIFITTPFSFLHTSKASNKAHIVIIGAGWGGLSAAKTLRQLNKNCKITIIEKQKNFISCPISNWVIGQIKVMKDITFSYKNFIKNNQIDMLFEEVKNIDIYKKKVYLNGLNLSYDKLIISPGVELEYNSINGLTNSFDNQNVFTAWKAGEETNLFSKRIKKLNNKENIIITIPLSPYRCPPGPYERASLLANFIKKYKLNNRIIILDANQKIVSKGKLFSKAWKELYSDIIDYRPDNNILSINSKEKKIFTDFDEYSYDIANIIPKQRAPKILYEAGLIKTNRKWASVNSFDFRSTEAKDVYIIGDATDKVSVGNVPKSGYIAYSMGKVCGYAVHSALLNKEPPSPSMINTCYSLVTENQGISVSAVYKHDKSKNKIISVNGASGISPNRSEIIAYNAWDWAQAIWKDMLS